MQTVGICASSIFLLAIMLMLFRVGALFLPPTLEELEEIQQSQFEEIEDDDLVVVLQGKSHKEIDAIARKAKQRK